jgi:hypothetical protein
MSEVIIADFVLCNIPSQHCLPQATVRRYGDIIY